jgi:hypothetical protein
MALVCAAQIQTIFRGRTANWLGSTLTPTLSRQREREQIRSLSPVPRGNGAIEQIRFLSPASRGKEAIGATGQIRSLSPVPGGEGWGEGVRARPWSFQ